MKHYLLNHQPQKGLQAASAQQGQAPTCNARGKGHTSASPKTLTKVILVLLTMFLLPNAAWGQGTITVAGNAPESDGTFKDKDSGETITGVTFEAQTNTLTLENANINGGIVYGGTETLKLNLIDSNIEYESNAISLNNADYQQNLTINFVGNNKIKSTSNNVFVGLKAPSSMDTTEGCSNITFDSSSTGSLTLEAGSTLSSWINLINGSGILATILSPDNGTVLANATKAVIYVSYGLTVAGVAVTSANYEDILNGDNADKVSFTPAEDSSSPATLTLNGANITYTEGNAIVSTLTTPLEVVLLNNSIINSGSKLPFQGAGNTNLVFNISGGDAASLVMSSTYDGFSPTSFYTGFNEVSYKGDLYSYLSGDKIVAIEKATSYGLTVAGVPVTSANANNITGDLITEGKVSFEPATVGADQTSIPATLTLNGATINGMIWTSLENLSIKLQGANKINVTSTGDNNSGANGIVTTSEVTGKTLTITKETGATLEISSTASAIRGFNALVHDGLYIETKVPYTSNETYVLSDKTANMDSIGVKWLKLSETETYPLWVGGVQATASNSGSGISSSGVTFNSEESTLTLNEAIISGAIYSTIGSLNVYLKSSSTITLPEGSTTAEPSFKFVGTAEPGKPVSLTFDSTDDEAGGLTMGGTLTKNNSGSNVTLTIGGYSVTNQFDDGTGTNLTGEWIYDSTSGKHHIFRNKLYGLWVGSYQVTRANKSSISSGYPTFDEDNLALRLTEEYTGLTIKSAMPALKLFVKGECSLKNIIFDTTYNPDSEPGTLTIEKDPDPNDPATNNSLSLSNTDGGVITGFSEVTIEAPLHVLKPFGQSVWDSSVTFAEISDWTWSEVEGIFEENNTYATYYNPEADMYLPSGYTPYVITGVSGSSVTTQALSYIPMGAMVLISKSENTATTAVTTGNMLKYADSGNPVTATETSNYYVLYNGKFVKVTRGTTIGGPDSRSGCYLDLSGVTAAGTRGFYDIDGGDGTTAIKDVKSGEVDDEKWADDGWHDLQGRKFTTKPTKPGLYILNGKKVAIK